MAVLERKSLVGDIECFLVDSPPTAVPVDAVGGSLICWEGDELTGRPTLWFLKRDDGLTTNVQPLAVYNFYAQASAPTVSTDETIGAYFGSEYFTTDDKIYKCANPAAGAAVWIQIV